MDIEDKIKVTAQVTTEVIAVRRGAKEVAGIDALSKIESDETEKATPSETDTPEATTSSETSTSATTTPPETTVPETTASETEGTTTTTTTFDFMNF